MKFMLMGFVWNMSLNLNIWDCVLDESGTDGAECSREGGGGREEGCRCH